MEYHLLGARTGLRVSSLALGTGRLDVAEAPRIFAAYLDAGGNFLDTSSAYLGGEAEELLGAFLAGGQERDRLVVASKYGRTPHGKGTSPASATSTGRVAAVGSHRKAMQVEVEGSLRRLRTDRIDVYFAHFDDGLTPMDEIMRGLDDLVRAGKILHAGLSNFPAWRCATAATLADARGWTPLAALQVLYNARDRDVERELLPFARAAGLGVMAYSPLGGGVLAKAHPAGKLLGWIASRGVIPVLGPRTEAQVRDLLVAAHDPAVDLDAFAPPALGYPHDILAQARAAYL